MTTFSGFRSQLITAAVALALLGMPQLRASQAKPFTRIDEAQVRAAMAAAVAAGKTNDLTVTNTFQKELRKLAPDYTNKAFIVHDSAELRVSVLGQAQMLIAMASSRITMGQPVEPLAWPAGISVQVSPINENAQDVVKTVVVRDGKEIEPIQSGLKIIKMGATGGMGAKRNATVHEGADVYSPATFDPGAKVEVQAVLGSGRKLSRTLNDSDLRKIQ